MSFDDVTKSLAETFGGQASVQADTLSGKMARMQRAFDEAKESVGARLLPILTQLLDTFNTKVGPAVEAIKDKLKPLTKAIDDNKEEFTALWNFLNKYIVPIMAGALKNAFSGIVTGITAVVNIVGKAVNFFQDLYAAYKKIVDFIKNNPLSQFLGKINPFSNSSFLTTGGGDDDFTDDTGGGNFTNPFFPNVPFVPSQAYLDAVARTEELKAETAAIRQRIADRKAGITNTLDTSTQGIVINVNAASVIDSEGFTRAVIDALNESQARTGSLDTLGV
jgi:tetrahydromethanopterin S-methyltransferase subunit B